MIIGPKQEGNWYYDMLNFISQGVFPTDLIRDERKRMALQSQKFVEVAQELYIQGIDNILRRCVPDHEQKAVLTEAHQGISRGHFHGDTLGKKILQARLWWPPTVLKDAHEFANRCNVCQRLGQPIARDRMPHTLVLALKPSAWNTRNKYILVATNYCTK